MNKKFSKIDAIALLLTVAGFGLKMAEDWLSEKQQNDIIEEKVNEALVKRLEQTEE